MLGPRQTKKVNVKDELAHTLFVQLSHVVLNAADDRVTAIPLEIHPERRGKIYSMPSYASTSTQTPANQTIIDKKRKELDCWNVATKRTQNTRDWNSN